MRGDSGRGLPSGSRCGQARPRAARQAPRSGAQPEFHALECHHDRPHLDHCAARRLPPSLEINGQETRFLVDQIRSIDTDYLIGDPVHYLERDELADVEHAVTRYLGL